jgi:hypothetical protein
VGKKSRGRSAAVGGTHGGSRNRRPERGWGERSRAVEEDGENGGGSAPEKIIRGGA